ncbi:MAG: hypothetical protein RDV41_13325, partial [Planctomycetota bacterium]|nr:hypothetical protein [Planctomycetota bacterium]
MVQTIRRRGSVLIVALGVMTVLVVLAVVFANLTAVERKISSNYVNLVKAKMLAQSGVEYAFTEIGNIFYWGNDGIDNDGDGSTDEADEQRPSIAEDANNPLLYGRRVPLPVLYDPTIPLERAYYVSLARMATPTTPVLVQIDMGMNSLIPGGTPGGVDSGTQNYGISGEVLATYPGGRDYYSLKIVDCQGKIYINGPDVNDTNPDLAQATGVGALTTNTITLLNNLGNSLTTTIPNLGNRISTYRQGIGANITTKQSLMSGLTPPLTQQQYDALAPHITAVAWVDYTTLHPDCIQTQFQLNSLRADDPTPLYTTIPISCADPAGGMEFVDGGDSSLKDSLAKIFRVSDDCKYSCGSERLVSHGPGYYAAHYTTYTNTQEQNTNSSAANGPCIQPRAPVNINTASDLVLRALLTGLRGRYQVFNASTTEPNVHMGPGHTSTYETTIDAAVAQNIAAAIVTARNTLVANRGFSFATWYDFEQFVDSLTDAQVGSSGAIAQARRDIIKANFNPNSKISKFNPDRTLGKRFAQTDKADLLYWTTEFCFNTAGYFEIESMGRILGPAAPGGLAPIMAEKKVMTTIRVYDMIKQSTQAQFYVNAVNSSPTQVAFFPESMSDNSSPSQSAAYGWYTSNPSPSGIPNYTMAAHYDGQFAAQTMDCNGANGNNCFQAHYTTDFDFYANGTNDQNDAAGPAEEGVSLINTATGGGGMGGQSELFPDGLFVHETRRYPTYTATQWKYGSSQLNCIDDYVRNTPASGKIAMQAGTVDMWVKPTWSAREFPCANTTDANEPNPHALGSRTLFSFGYGSNAW